MTSGISDTLTRGVEEQASQRPWFFGIGALKQNEALENAREEIVECRVIGADVAARADG